MTAPTDPEARGYQVASALLDITSAIDYDSDPATNEAALSAASQRLTDIGAAPVVAVEGMSMVEATGLIQGATLLVNILVDRLALATGQAREAVIAETRELVDGLPELHNWDGWPG